VATDDVLFGLVIDEVIDIVEEALDVRPSPDRPDLVGTAILRGRATEILDLAEFLPRAGGHRPDQHGSRGSATVLLVDDSAFFRDMLGPVLRAAGYRVRVAASAGEALRAMLLHPVDAVVTDIELPDQPGLEMVESIRRHPGSAETPVVVLASRAEESTLARARQLGVAEVVSKFDRSGLIAGLARATARTKALAA
jgi:two-component system chemotaxis sensor kinase CheA